MQDMTTADTAAGVSKDEDTESVRSDTNTGDYDGGMQAWLTVLGSCLVYFSVFGVIQSFGFFQEYYQNSYLASTPASVIAFIGTLQITVMNLLAAPAGSIFDCYGLVFPYIFSGIGCSVALVALSFCQPGVIWQPFLIQGVLIGIAIAFGAQAAIVVAAQHFPRHRALAMAIVAAAGSTGGVCFPIIFTQLMPRVGFAWSLRAVAVVIVLCYTMAFFLSTRKYGPRPLTKIWTLLDFRGFRDRRYSVLTFGAFIAMLGQFVPYYYIGKYRPLHLNCSYSTAANPDAPAKQYLLPIMNAASIIGRLLGGLAADELGPLNVVYPMTILSGLQCLGMWLVTSNIRVLVAFVSLYGFCSGVFIAVLPAIVAQISPEENLGGRIGALYSVLSIAQLVGTPIGGALITSNTVYGYDGLIIFGVSCGPEDFKLCADVVKGTTLLVGGVVLFVDRLLYSRDLLVRF
ncbi:major facilitator superfamily domain-containing protein [Massariosphaeria phaeospora]|uniref:Major facilitator superfamily domain-containing protein n=1 Tax=Massariosphaeria phaeospora TaxID=100035 RepID=A0A7C8HZ65_9PLEO|nr:major facilitator superfamily domain-containing protein [Massariosphaeria phaeospora]